MSKVQTVNGDESATKIYDILRKDGCIVVDGLLDDQELKQLQFDLGHHFDKTPNCQGDFYGYGTKRISSLFIKSIICQKMAILPLVKAVMDEFLLKSCSQYQINLTQGISIGPKEYPQVIHRDDNLFPYVELNHEKMINCMWAIDDFTEENGATRLIPGSHLWPRNNIIDMEQIQHAQTLQPEQGIMKAGSLLIYFGSLYHSGGQNKTDKARRGAVISYNLGWLRQAENSYLAYSKEAASEMPEELQKLLGYFVHSPNLGSIEGQDPIKLLDGTLSIDGRFEEFIPAEAKVILQQYRNGLKEAA